MHPKEEQETCFKFEHRLQICMYPCGNVAKESKVDPGMMYRTGDIGIHEVAEVLKNGWIFNYPPAIKRGVMKKSRYLWTIFQFKPPFSSGFTSLPRFMTPELMGKKNRRMFAKFVPPPTPEHIRLYQKS